MNQVTTIMLLIVILISILSINLNLYISNRTKNKLLAKELEQKELKLYNDILFSLENVYNIIDSLIEQTLTEHRMLTENDNENYISDKEAKRIINTVATTILQEMSPTLYSYMNSVFGGEQNINSVIVRRTILEVSKLVAVVNEKAKAEDIANNNPYYNDLNKIMNSF